MLVLTRKPSEGIQIGDRITVIVLEVRGNRVRLGIDAPKEIPILRGELTGGMSSVPVMSAMTGTILSEFPDVNDEDFWHNKMFDVKT